MTLRQVSAKRNSVTGLWNEGEPVGAQGVPLTPGRSIANDRLHEYAATVGTSRRIMVPSVRRALREIHFDIKREQTIEQRPVCTPTAARAGANGSWCANYGTGHSGTDCSFTSFEQCRATVSGVYGFC
jgi:hypothetical protein